jgi:hypothetical protein
VILGFTVNLDTPTSRLEKILKSIIDGTEYTAPPLSRLEEDFLKYKAESGSIGMFLSRIEEIMKNVIEGTDYKGVRLSRIEEMLEGMDVDEQSLFSSDRYGLISSDNYRLLTRR